MSDAEHNAHEPLGTSSSLHRQIFVALDGTEAQELVLDRALAVAHENHAALVLAHVIDSSVIESSGTYPVDLIPELEFAFRNSLADALAKAEGDPNIASVEVLVQCGRIRETLADLMLEKAHPDLVICGARGLGALTYVLLGSVSTWLIRNAPCDVLVVKDQLD